MSIWKFQFKVDDRVTIDMPAGAKILHVELQNGVPCLWALVDTSAEPEPRKFLIFGTGHPISGAIAVTAAHVATFQQGPFVWHMFE